MMKKIVILILSLLWHVVSFSQELPQIKFDSRHKVVSITSEDGMPSRRPRCILQSRDGYIWFGPGNYLCKYDGVEVKTYTPKDKEVVFSDFMMDFFEDNHGYIWIPSKKGMFRFDPVQEEFKLYESKHKIEPGWTENIIQSKDGIIWHFQHTLLQILDADSESDTFEIFELPKINPEIGNDISRAIDKGEVLADLTKIKINENRKIDFELKQLTTVLIVGQGEFYGNSLSDYGWIEDAEGNTVWRMSLNNSLSGGGDWANCIQIDTISLAKGNYSLRFISDGWFSYPDWDGNEPPVFPEWWGIQVFTAPATETEGVISQWRQQKKEIPLPVGYLPFIDREDNFWLIGEGNISKLSYSRENGELSFVIEKIIDGAPWKPSWGPIRQDSIEGGIWIPVNNPSRNNDEFAGFIFFDPENNSIKTLNHPMLPTEEDDGVGRVPKIIRFEIDHNGGLWFATEMGYPRFHGLYHLPKPFRFEEDNPIPGSPYQHIFTGNANGLKIDSENRLWMGTDRRILKMNLEPRNLDFVDFSSVKSNLDKVDNVIASTRIYEDEERNVWVSNAFIHGPFQYSIPSKTIKHFPRILEFDSPYYYPLLEDSFGNFWWGLDNKIIRQNKKSGAIKSFELNVKERARRFWFEMIELENKDYIVLCGGNVFRLNTILEEFTPIFQSGGDSNTQIRKILKDSRKGFWTINQYGLLTHIDIEKNQVNTIKVYDTGVWVNNTQIDEVGNIWIGGRSGLTKYFSTNDSLAFYGYENGMLLTHTHIRAMEWDQNGAIWIMANGKDNSIMYRFDPEKERFYTYSLFDGLKLLNSPFSLHSNKRGTLHALTESGFITFSPQDIQASNKVPLIRFTDIKVANESILSLDENKVRFNIEGQSFELSHHQNDLSLEFTGIKFEDGHQIAFAYQMIGIDHNWVEVGDEKVARYPNLSSGKYTFLVKAANVDGVWSEPKSLIFTILPPWWQTWWAYALYVLAGVGTLLWYIRSINQKLQKEQAYSNKLANINAANQRFVPNDFLQILGKESIEDLRLGDQTATKMTILFSDIRDYTPLSESMTPEENFKFINAYLGRVGPIIKAHGGFISSYLGDGLMALFVNEPQKAIAATIVMQKELENYNQERRAAGKRALRTGMGLNTGDLMLGVIGDEHRYESTVISDAVNTASRMEGLTKVFGAAIILSEKTLAGLRSDGRSPRNRGFAYRYLGKVKVKGKDKALKIYDLYEGETVAIRELKAQTKRQFEQGIDFYFNRKFGKAAECFKQVLAMNESDKAAVYYLEKSVHYIVNGVAEDWSGVEEMVIK